jgi:hypothetical protein
MTASPERDEWELSPPSCSPPEARFDCLARDLRNRHTSAARFAVKRRGQILRETDRFSSHVRIRSKRRSTSR